MLQLLVRGGRGHQQALAVAGCEAADDARAGNGGAHDGDDVLQLGLEDTARVVMLDFVVFWFHAECFFTCKSSRWRRGPPGRMS